MCYQEMKHKKLICIQTITNAKVYLDIVRILTRNQEINVLDALEVSL